MSNPQDLARAAGAARGGRFAEAADLASTVVARDPANAAARWLLAQCLERLARPAEALAQLEALCARSAGDLAAIDRIAAHLLQHGHPLDTALAAYERHLQANPKAATAAFNLAYYLGKAGRAEQAIERYRQAVELGVRAPEEAELNCANLCTDRLHDPQRAQAHLDRALRINPRYAAAHFNLGNLAEQRGAREEAARHFARCLELEPGNETALARLADTHVFADAEDPLLARLRAAAPGSRNADLHFALGRALDQLADYAGAWAHFNRANALDRAAFPPYRPDEVAAAFHRIPSAFDAARPCSGDGDSHAPVFICGMFRTGSTLLERMLDAHPAFAAGGESPFFPRLVARELPDYPDGLDAVDEARLSDWRERHRVEAERVAGPGARLTDKRPDNFLYAGLIGAVLPGARFVVTERDWRDTAVSLFATRLGPGQNYATRLEDIRHYLDLQRELVDYWVASLGGRLVRVRYEDLVRDPRRILGGLLEFLGVDWDERCLSFHGDGGSVRTASAWQVRQPLHERSIGRWRNYREPFEQAFGADLTG